MALKGQKEHLRRMRNIRSESVKAAARVLQVGAAKVRADAQHMITMGSVSGRSHQPSTPGEPPNNDTGVLKSHIEDVLINPGLAEVRSNAPYSAPLEFGTSKMAERPFMRPARDKNVDYIERLAAKELNKVINKSGR